MELLHKLDENIITREEAQFEVERFWVGALRRAAVDGRRGQGLPDGRAIGGAGERDQALAEVLSIPFVVVCLTLAIRN
ncbi:MAG: hypothetical protein MZV70_33325 [Desulfobacterales bacterium]|nr:hypothetical protein [Desulfobacterales bacterium]